MISEIYLEWGAFRRKWIWCFERESNFIIGKVSHQDGDMKKWIFDWGFDGPHVEPGREGELA